MNKTIVISAIVLVTVVMGMSAMVPVIAQPPVVPPVTPVPPDPPGTPDVECEDLAALLALLIENEVITPEEAEVILADAGC